MRRIRDELAGALAILAALYIGLTLVTYNRWDQSLTTTSTEPVGNLGGIVGSYLADLLISLLVGFASYLIPVVLIVFGIRRILGREKRRLNLAGSLLLILSLSLMSALMNRTFSFPLEINPGGFIGTGTSGILVRFLSLPGAYIVAISLLVSSVILLSPLPFSTLLKRDDSGKKKPRQEAVPEKGIIEEEIIVPEPEPEPSVSMAAEPPKKPRRAAPPAKPPQPVVTGGYTLPSVELLTAYDYSAAKNAEEETRANIPLLKAKLADFGVDGAITHAKRGPVVTMYEFEPAAGVKINRVVSLSDDLALALKAQSLRVSPIPGENRIGIEVPNRQRQIVGFRDLISSDRFQKSQTKLTLALGKNIFGEPVVTDLTKMPHLLVAGTTGAGKSVSINSMVMSILYKASPREVKMLMIDPKLLELSVYEDIPHLISPVITNPKQSAEALRKMVFEMERRYRLLAEKGARNIESYNKTASEEEQMPYIVIFIDELADLMFASSREIEDSVARLAQMARAAGIHLIIATQRPSVDVITGVIKANFPARISFQVLSKIDSRTILDTQGAEQLLGKGDMLMLTPGSRLMRIHGALVTEEEIRAVTDFVKSQGSPDFGLYEQIPTEPPAEETEDEERDEMYDRSVEFAESVGEVSISSIQRRFKIGYNRAARIVELMERDGHVGPSKGAGKPREFRRHGFRG